MTVPVREAAGRRDRRRAHKRKRPRRGIPPGPTFRRGAVPGPERMSYALRNLLNLFVDVGGAGGLDVTRARVDLALALEGRQGGVAVQVGVGLGGEHRRGASAGRVVDRAEVV